MNERSGLRAARQRELPLRTVGPVSFYRFREPLSLRILQLVIGLALFGVALALTIEAAYGTNPWTVFHQGLADNINITVGTAVVITGLAVLILDIALREPLGLGTVLNVAIIGPALDISLALIPPLETTPARLAAIIAAPAILGLGSGLYIGAGLGNGPRDALMTALAARGFKISTARTIIELTALGVGWLLGGTVGLGTVWFGLSVGWFIRWFLPRLTIT